MDMAPVTFIYTCMDENRLQYAKLVCDESCGRENTLRPYIILPLLWFLQQAYTEETSIETLSIT